MVMARNEWLKAWAIPEADADRAWAEKQAFDARHTSSAMIISDYIDPVLSHANGKIYDSKSGLYASYLPSGNPQGERYECIGEKVAEPFERKQSTRDERMQAVKRTLDGMGI